MAEDSSLQGTVHAKPTRSFQPRHISQSKGSIYSRTCGHTRSLFKYKQSSGNKSHSFYRALGLLLCSPIKLNSFCHIGIPRFLVNLFLGIFTAVIMLNVWCFKAYTSIWCSYIFILSNLSTFSFAPASFHARLERCSALQDYGAICLGFLLKCSCFYLV